MNTMQTLVVQEVLNRHERAKYHLYCDDIANIRHNEKTEGIAYRVWRIRVYLAGFFSY
jgi:hypothetical protein